MILLELTGAINAAGETRTYYLTGPSAFTTKPTDAPSDQTFETRLLDPGAISVSIYSGGGGAIFGGASRMDLGEIIATNIDGGLDELKNVSFDGREIVMRAPDKVNPAEYPADYPAILAATMEGVDVTARQAIVKVRDHTFVFEKPLLTERFKGTNVPGDAGIEGTADDIKDTLKPAIFGLANYFAPPCVNPGKATYQVNNGPVDDISAVYVRGAPQARVGPDHATAASLQAATVAGGTYQTCLAEGLFRLGLSADGQVTCDAAEGSEQGRSCAQLLRRLAIMAGVAEVNISDDDVTLLDQLNSTPLGIYVSDERTFLDVMEWFARSIGAWFGFDPTGILRMGRLDAPQGLPLATLEERQVITAGMERTVLQELPVPLWSVTVNHSPIWKTQESDLAGSVTPERREFLRNQYRRATDAAEAIKTQFRLAGSLTVDTLLTDAAAATAEAKRVRELHDSPHDVFDVPVPIDEATALIQRGLWLGSELAVDVPRFGLSGGRSFIVLGITIQRRARQVVFRLWSEVELAARRFAAGAGDAAGFGLAAAVGQTSSGVVSGAGHAHGSGEASGASDQTTADGGQPSGLLLAILKP